MIRARFGYKKNGLRRIAVKQEVPGKVLRFRRPEPEPEPVYCPVCRQLCETEREIMEAVSMREALEMARRYREGEVYETD